MTAITIKVWIQPPVCGNLGLMFRPKKPSSHKIIRITMIVHNMRFLLLSYLLMMIIMGGGLSDTASGKILGSVPASARLLQQEGARNQPEYKPDYLSPARKRLSWASGFFNGFFHILYPPVDFLFGVFAGVAKLFLKQTGEDVVITGDTIKIIVGDPTPPHFGLASHLFPLTF